MNPINQLQRFIDLFQFSEKLEIKGNALAILRGPIIPGLVVGLFGYMTLTIVLRYLNLEIWRHDSFQYTLDSTWYEGNLKQEGRWINYFLFDLIKPIPAHIAALVNLASTAVFGYLITTSLVKDKFLGVLVGLSFLQLPVLHAQNMWPNITLVAFIFLPIFYFLSKKLHPIVLFAVSAIFYFGTLSHFYFLVPLIYLGRIKNAVTGNVKEDGISVVLKYLLPYALCFVIGFIVANAVVTLKTGGPIEVGEWRKPTPIDGFPQLLANLSGIHARMFAFLSKSYSEVHIAVWIAITSIALLTFNKKNVWVFIVLAAAFLSPFYTTIYHGIMISDRTLMVAAIPFTAVFVLFPALRFKSNLLHFLLCVAFIWPFFQTSSKQIKLFSDITGYYKQQLASTTASLDPTAYSEVFVFITRAEVSEVNAQIRDYYGQNFKWGESLNAVDRTVITVLRSLGFKQVFMVTNDDTIQNVKNQIGADTRASPYSIIDLAERPSAIGIVMNNTVVDIALLEPR